MKLAINRNMEIHSDLASGSVRRALENLRRDIDKACEKTDRPGISLVLQQEAFEEERFLLFADREGERLVLQAGSDLGFIYGIYEISRSILGIQNFWFWNDQHIERREEYPLPEGYRVEHKPYAVSLRGWFVNDEVLLSKWSVDYSSDKPWEMVFEALLRCGGNMVIPGTDRNSRRYRELASDMGLSITHHHAEPLGAEMFARIYPELEASFDQYKDKFKKLWAEGIESQAGMKVVWNLGFRGQGDRPFWEDDPVYDTPAKRGELISRLILIQYDMVKEKLPDAACCINLYGETMELYQEGYLKLPDDVIRIWADNGYGKMVTRRQCNHNPRIPALPEKNDPGKNGIYYHVSFYDLQAASHMTELANGPEFVRRELIKTLEHGCGDYWIVNCSNVKPHVYYLDLIAQMWKNGDVDIEEHRLAYAEQYYGAANAKKAAHGLREYHAHAVAYGPHEDDRAGEQFATHVGRMLVSAYMKGIREASEDLQWMTEAESLREQVLWYQEISRRGEQSYRGYLDLCERLATQMEGAAGRRLFGDSLLMQAQILYHCFAGASGLCISLLAALEEDYRKAFYYAGRAAEEYLAADGSMRAREHGKWKGFYANECLADMKQSVWLLKGYMSYVRNLDDGPDFHTWQRELTYSEEDRRVMLILMTENHLPDEKIYELMKKRELFET